MLTWELYNWQYFTRSAQGLALMSNQKQDAKKPVSPPPTWVLHDGPAFTTGMSHVGTMYNKVLKDIVNRYKLLLGYRVHYMPGFDCFGTNVEDYHY